MSDTPAPGGLRHAVDRVGGLGIEGWALRADGRAVEIGLRLAHDLLPCHLERLPRPDVLQHLGLSAPEAALDCGFLLRPDSSVWAQKFGQREVTCTLVLDGQPAAEVTLGLPEGELCAWLDSLALRPLDDAERRTEWQHLRPFVDTMGGELAAWVHARWAQAPATATVHCAVDRVDALHVVGWAWAPEARGEHFTLRCGRQTWPLPARRVERLDVRQALPGAGVLAGFELELPADIWRVTGPVGDAWVQVCVNGRPLWQRPLRVTRQVPLQALARAMSTSAASGGQAEAVPWSLVDHVLAAGVWEQVPAIIEARVRRALGDDERHLLPPSRVEGAATHRATPDPDTETVWRLQQAFNRALAGQGDPAQALDRVLAATVAVSPRARQDFLTSLVPGFCAAGALPALRAHLGQAPAAEVAAGDDRWSQSLRLALLVDTELAEGRLTGAVAAAAHLGRAGAGGWLNTAALRASLARLREALANGRVVDDEELHRFVGHLLALWADLGADPCWSRLPDQALIEAQVELLAIGHYLGEAQALEVLDSALRLYALTPAFWQAMDAAWPADQWPAPLAEAAAQVRPLLAAVAAGEAQALTRADALTTFAWARRLGCVDAPAWQRHALATLRHEPGLAAPLAEGLPPADGWRLGAAGPGIQPAWRALDPVPAPEHAGRQSAAWQGWATRPDGAPAKWLAVAGERAGFVGLALLAGWSAGDPGRWLPLADVVDKTLAACERRRDGHPLPPAALCTALAATAWPTGAQAVDRDAWLARAEALWGSRSVEEALRRPATPRCRARLAGAGVLVLRRAEPGPMPGWAARLQDLEAPWFDLAHWCPGAAPDASVPQAPVFDAPGLWPLLRQLLADTDHGSFVILPADAEVAVDAWLARTQLLGSHYAGSASARPFARLRPSAEPAALPRVDTSPSGTRFAAAEEGLVLSRAAAAWALARLEDGAAPPWALAAVDDDKRLADVLLSLGILLDERGQVVQHTRRPLTAAPVTAFADAPDPGPDSPTVMRLGPPLSAPLPQAPGAHRIWPCDRAPSLVGAQGSQQLVRLSTPFGGAAGDKGEVSVFAVARNERVLMPHFLAHYRALGVRRFVIADNLSTDGTREYLLAQPDVALYSVDTPYKLSHYGVAWQQAMLAEHAQGRWALVVDIDELLVWPGCERETLASRCARLAAGGHDAALALMVDMYPEGPLDSADFERGTPFAEAPCFDATPALPWRLGSGSYSNSPSYVSSARHRLLPGSPPNHYTAQKVPLVRYSPALRWSEGLHYAAGVQRAPEPLFLAHFKYHRGFRAKVEEEVARRQHYNDAEEYRKYRALWAEARGIMFDPAVSRRWVDSHSFADIAAA